MDRKKSGVAERLSRTHQLFSLLGTGVADLLEEVDEVQEAILERGCDSQAVRDEAIDVLRCALYLCVNLGVGRADLVRNEESMAARGRPVGGSAGHALRQAIGSIELCADSERKAVRHVALSRDVRRLYEVKASRVQAARAEDEVLVSRRINFSPGCVARADRIYRILCKRPPTFRARRAERLFAQGISQGRECDTLTGVMEALERRGRVRATSVARAKLGLVAILSTVHWCSVSYDKARPCIPGVCSCAYRRAEERRVRT